MGCINKLWNLFLMTCPREDHDGDGITWTLRYTLQTGRKDLTAIDIFKPFAVSNKFLYVYRRRRGDNLKNTVAVP